MNVFARIVCGVDGTPASLAAVRRAAQLADDASELLLVTVANDASMAAATAGAAGLVLLPAAEEAGRTSLEQAVALAGSEFPKLRVEARVLEGPLLPTLLETLADWKATLVAVGRHGHSRLAGLVLGSVTTTLLHDAPCPVLVVGAGSGPEEGPFPRTIVVGYDGSEQADEAVRVAAGLARRTGASLQALCATGGEQADVDRLQARLTELAPGVSLAVQDADAADALESQDCDLLVVGNRGLHGLKALGSISERVAHRAEGSVLVVR